MGWNLSTATYDSVFYDPGQDDLTGLFYRPDGTKMYVCWFGTGGVYQHTLSTAWDMTTASYDLISYSASPANNITGLFFKPDGTKMYLVENAADNIRQYTLSTAWNVSTATYDSVSLNVTSQNTNPRGIFFKPDGTKMYMVGIDTDAIYQYSLSTAWDLSTASYDSVLFNITSQDTTPLELFFRPDGKKMYIVGLENNTVYQYTLSTAWDVSTASYDSVSFSVSGQSGFSHGLFFRSDGEKMYVSNFDPVERIYQYSLTNVGPTVDAGTDKSGDVGGTLSPFNDATFSDPDGIIVTVEYKIIGEVDVWTDIPIGGYGSLLEAAQAFEYQFNNAGDIVAALRVTDDGDLTDEDNLIVTILTDRAPVVTTDVDAALITASPYDMQIDTNGDIKTADFFDTAILMSLFCERRAEPSEVPESHRRRGWVGNESTPTFEIGSKLWLYSQERATRTVLRGIETVVLNGLQWLIDDGYALDITTIAALASGLVTLNVVIKRPDSIVDNRFYKLWGNTGGTEYT